MMVLKYQGLDLIPLARGYYHLKPRPTRFNILNETIELLGECWILLFSKFELPLFRGKIIVLVGRYIPECNLFNVM